MHLSRRQCLIARALACHCLIRFPPSTRTSLRIPQNINFRALVIGSLGGTGVGNWVNFCQVFAAGLSELLFCGQLQTPFLALLGKYVIFAIPTQSLSIFMINLFQDCSRPTHLLNKWYSLSVQRFRVSVYDAGCPVPIASSYLARSLERLRVAFTANR